MSRLRRSRLYIPGNNASQIVNAGITGADCVILDLEDAVPVAEKDASRILIKHALRSVDFGDVEVIVRVNPMTTEYGRRDLELAREERLDTILLPKCECRDDVKDVEGMIERIENDCGREKRTKLMPLIETAKGVLNAKEIAESSARIVALCFGAEDFTADIGGERSREGKEIMVARSYIVLAAKSAGIQALDTIYPYIDDEEGLLRETKEAIQMGFDGKGAIHPAQIEIIHRAFTPTEEEIRDAKEIIRAIEDAKARGKAVASIGRKMIDAPVVRRAERTLQIARIMNLIKEDE